MFYFLVQLSLFLLLSSCMLKKQGPQSHLAAPLNTDDKLGLNEAEEVLRINLEYKISVHPTAARSYFTPLTGSAYPNRGIERGVQNTLTQSLAAYDRIHKTKTLDWEIKNHNHTFIYQGHCNGWAAQVSRHEEPRSSVNIEGETFTPEMIKALLTEIYMSHAYIPLGGKLCKDKESKLSPQQRAMSNNPLDIFELKECNDVNPAQFHLAITNIIGGPRQLPIIMDRDTAEQVWNFPIYAYTCQNCVNNEWKQVSREEALRLLGVNRPSYVFNPAAKRFYYVELVISYVAMSDVELLQQRERKADLLSYIIETDDESRILGGEWTQRSQSTHPDMIWFPLGIGAVTGEKAYANPEVSSDFVLSLWRKSIEDRADEVEKLYIYAGEERRSIKSLFSPSWSCCSNTWQSNRASALFDPLKIAGLVRNEDSFTLLPGPNDWVDSGTVTQFFTLP